MSDRVLFGLCQVIMFSLLLDDDPAQLANLNQV